MTKLNLLAASSLAVSLALALAACGRSGDSIPDLLLVSARDGDYATYVLNADGSAQKRLTENPAHRSSNGVFFQVEADWSPDGRRIAFASRRHGSFDIYVMNADGTGTRRLTATSDDDDNPTWSPDGRRLAFNRAGDIYVMRADGTGVRRVTVDVDPQTDPAWSPDGTWIAYVRGSQGTVGVDLREVWLVQPDGKRNHALTTMGASSYSPAWSPDSTRIAFACMVETLNSDICAVRSDGTGLVRLTLDPSWDAEPAWSPEGDKIAFVTTRYGGEHLAVLNTDGSGVSQLGGVQGREPAWSLDGRYIAATALYSGIFAMKADGSDGWGITYDGDVLTSHSPSWMPRSPNCPISTVTAPRSWFGPTPQAARGNSSPTSAACGIAR